METPDQHHQQGDVDEDRPGERPVGQAAEVRPGEAAERQRQVDGERPRHRREARAGRFGRQAVERSEEHTSELQSLMRLSYAVFFLTKKNNTTTNNTIRTMP